MGSKKPLALLNTKSCRLMTMMVLTASFFLVELIVGYITHSLALVADSFHMLSDIIALVVGFVAVRYAKRDTPKNTYGWQRAEVVGALVNTVFLFALCFTIVVDAVERLVMPQPINDPRLVLIVGGVGLAVNVLGILLFSSHGMGHGHSHGGGGGHGHGHSHGGSHSHDSSDMAAVVSNGIGTDVGLESSGDGHSHDVEAGVEAKESSTSSQSKSAKRVASSSQLNMRGVFLHVLGDALGSVVVIISALVIMFVDSDWVNYVDPVLSIFIAIIICSTTLPLFKQSSMILLQSIPTGIDIEGIENKLREQCSSIHNIHEFHVWQLTGAKLIATLHVSVSNLEEYCEVAKQINKVLNEEGVYSITIQPEVICEKHEDEQDCSIPCRPDVSSENNKCCGNTRRIVANRSTVSMSALQMEVNDLECVSEVVQKAASTQTCIHEMDNRVVCDSRFFQDFQVKIVSTV